MNDTKKIAVFIDAENIPAKYADSIIAKINSYGDAVILRAYSDWSQINTAQWKDFVTNNPIQAIQQFHKDGNTDVKEAVDKAIVMDGIELAIKSPDIDTFCLVSSDKGYSEFILKLRSLGKYVLGIGEKKSGENSRYVKAFNEFVYSEDLQEIDAEVLLSPDAENISEDDMQFSLSKFIAQCFESTPKINGNSVLLSRLGESVLRQKSDFDYKKFGFKNLYDLVNQFPDEYEITDDGKTVPTHIVTRKEREKTDGSGQELINGIIFRRIAGYGFVRDENDGEYFFYVNDAPEGIRANLKKDVKVRCTVLKKPDKNASISTEKNGRVKIVSIVGKTEK